LPEQGGDRRNYVSQKLAGAGADSCCLLDILDLGQVLRLGVRVIEASGQRGCERVGGTALDPDAPGFLPGLVHGSSRVQGTCRRCQSHGDSKERQRSGPPFDRPGDAWCGRKHRGRWAGAASDRRDAWPPLALPVGENMSDRPGPARVTPAKTGSPPPQTSRGGMPQRPVPDPDDLAELAARLQADCEMRDKLAAQGFAGETYAVLEDELAGYGYQLMTAWLASGHIFTRCRQAGLGTLSLPIPFSDREDLAQETVADALGSFRRKGLVQGGWRPDGGASMKAYFTGALLLQFANIWRRRLRAPATSRALSLDTLPTELESLVPDPADVAVQRDEIRRALVSMENDRTRIALVLTQDGYEQDEIAEILGPGTTPRAVEGLLRRHRRRLAARHDEDGEPR
jgi:DNA-directed RNA polymerase specialized sigma24 family protein